MCLISCCGRLLVPCVLGDSVVCMQGLSVVRKDLRSILDAAANSSLIC